jgi:hypothetical protein
VVLGRRNRQGASCYSGCNLVVVRCIFVLTLYSFDMPSAGWWLAYSSTFSDIWISTPTSGQNVIACESEYSSCLLLVWIPPGFVLVFALPC